MKAGSESKNCGLYCTTFEPTLASIRTRTDARAACVVALNCIVRSDSVVMRPKPRPPPSTAATPKENAPCISDFGGGGGMHFEKGEGVFFRGSALRAVAAHNQTPSWA